MDVGTPFVTATVVDLCFQIDCLQVQAQLCQHSARCPCQCYGHLCLLTFCCLVLSQHRLAQMPMRTVGRCHTGPTAVPRSQGTDGGMV